MNLNYSRTKTFHQCPRRYFWLYEFDGLGLESPVKNEKFIIGSMVHAGLAALYSECSIAQAHEFARQSLRHDYPDIPLEDQQDWDDNIDMVERMLTEYYQEVMPKDDFSPIIENIESEFRVEVEDSGHFLIGRVDLPVNRDGQIKIIDHKTAGSVSSLYLESWHYSPQLLGYSYGYGKAMGVKVRGYGVNILRKLKTIGTEKRTHKVCPDCHNGSRKKVTCLGCNGEGKVAKPPEKVTSPFQREWESIGELDTKRFVSNFIQTANDIVFQKELFQRSSEHLGIPSREAWPMNCESCFSYGKCSFVGVCHSTDPDNWQNPSMELLSNFEVRKPDYVDDFKEMKREESV